MEKASLRKISGWGRYPVVECQVYRPEKRRGVQEILSEVGPGGQIARGLGRSYGDAPVNEGGGVIDMTRLNRMLEFDQDMGLLTCEAGVNLAEILDTFIPRGYFPPVTPGTKFVTIGGAIAQDAHGKNHHKDGSFSEFVRWFDLLLATGEIRRCSREENADIFWATVGGIGLTGVILTACVELRKIETAYFNVDYIQSRNIEETLSLFAESDERYTYSVAWVDCLARGASLGRSVLMRGNHLSAVDMPPRKDPLHIRKAFPKMVPFNFPAFALNPYSIKAFNEAFYRLHPTSEGKIVDYDSYFYPLDAIQSWNRLYGRRGFTQYQVTLPPSQAEGLTVILERLSASSRASFLAVLKCFGPGGQGMLSHPMKGFTLTLDIPIRKGLTPFLHDMDELLLKFGGRLYLAKDVMTRPETFAAMYPRLNAFREVKALVDPNNALSSSMSRRLRIME